MKRFLEELKGAKNLEWLLLFAVAAIMLMFGIGQWSDSAVQRTDAEIRLISALSKIEGVGRIDALITETESKTNVLVIAEGVSDMNAYLHIQRAVQAMVDIELSDIEIIPHGG